MIITFYALPHLIYTSMIFHESVDLKIYHVICINMLDNFIVILTLYARCSSRMMG